MISNNSMTSVIRFFYKICMVTIILRSCTRISSKIYLISQKQKKDFLDVFIKTYSLNLKF